MRRKIVQGPRVKGEYNPPPPTATPVRDWRNHNPHGKRGIVPWDAPKMFAGQVVCIIGGGPSLKNYDLSPLEGQRCIAVNNSYKIAPWADILHFADASWWQWNGDHVLKNWPQDRIITTATSDVASVNHPRVKRFWRDRGAFTEDRTKLHGWDSGTQAIHMAYHLGARRIVLFGIDMQPAKDGACQWHDEHKRPTKADNYQSRFAPSLTGLVGALRKRGVEVVRVTEPGLPCIAPVSLETAFAAP